MSARAGEPLNTAVGRAPTRSDGRIRGTAGTAAPAIPPVSAARRRTRQDATRFLRQERREGRGVTAPALRPFRPLYGSVPQTRVPATYTVTLGESA